MSEIPEKWRKFAAYWEAQNRPQLEVSTDGSKWRLLIDPPTWSAWFYRFEDDPHWELRKRWVDSDFKLTILCRENDRDDWRVVRNPSWSPDMQYRTTTAKGILEMNDAKFLEWIHDCLENVHGENSNSDYMYRLRDIIASLDDATPGPQPEPAASEHPLEMAFRAAVAQATGGKGVRHGGAVTPFWDQQWYHNTLHTGIGGPMFQAVKKAKEACAKPDREAFERELLGAMVYLGMTYIFVQRHGYPGAFNTAVDKSEK